MGDFIAVHNLKTESTLSLMTSFAVKMPINDAAEKKCFVDVLGDRNGALLPIKDFVSIVSGFWPVYDIKFSPFLFFAYSFSA